MTNKIDSIKQIELEIDFSELPEGVRKSNIFEEIAIEIYNGWPGKTWLQRIQEKIKFISEVLPEYSKMYWKNNIETLEKLAKARSCNYTNWFQNGNIPKVKDVLVYKNSEDFFKKHPEKKYICPACGGESTNPNECNTWIKKDGKVCDWKVYGLFGDLWKWVNIFFTDKMEENPIPQNIFKPVNLS